MGSLAERQCLLLNKQERRLSDSPDSEYASMEESWKSLWCPFSPHEAHHAERLLAQDWLPRFSIQLFIYSLACFWWEDTLHHNTMQCWLHLEGPSAWQECRTEKLRPVMERYLGNCECAGRKLILMHKANFIIDFYSTDQFLLNMLTFKKFLKIEH